MQNLQLDMGVYSYMLIHPSISKGHLNGIGRLSEKSRKRVDIIKKIISSEDYSSLSSMYLKDPIYYTLLHMWHISFGWEQFEKNKKQYFTNFIETNLLSIIKYLKFIIHDYKYTNKIRDIRIKTNNWTNEIINEDL